MPAEAERRLCLRRLFQLRATEEIGDRNTDDEVENRADNSCQHTDHGAFSDLTGMGDDLIYKIAGEKAAAYTPDTATVVKRKESRRVFRRLSPPKVPALVCSFNLHSFRQKVIHGLNLCWILDWQRSALNN